MKISCRLFISFFLLSLVLLSAGWGVFAQSATYQFMHFDIRQGLSNNQVNCFLKDRKGFLWFGTLSGLNRYDGYAIRTFLRDRADSTSLRSNHILRLSEAPDGKIWVTTIDGITVYNPDTERFTHSHLPECRRYGIPEGDITDISRDPGGNYWFLHAAEGVFVFLPSENRTVRIAPAPPVPVTGISHDRHGNTWLIRQDGMLLQIDGNTYKVVYTSDHLRETYAGALLNYRVYCDRDDDLWIYVERDNKGIFHFDARTRAFRQFRKERGKLNADIIMGVVEDNRGTIWIGTDHGGINLLNKESWKIQHLVRGDQEKDLRQNTINALYKDAEGIIWIGMYKEGINYYHENIYRFPHYAAGPTGLGELPYHDFNRFAEDADGNLWMGSNGAGLLFYDRKSGAFRQYLHDPQNPNSIGSNVIVSLLTDSRQNLWIGTYYGGLTRFDGRNFTTYRHDPDNPESISDDSVWEILEDRAGNLWIGTLNGGLELLDRKTGRFRHFPAGAPNSVHASYVSEILEDRNGMLWIGTSYGLETYNPVTGIFERHYLTNPGDPQSLSSNLVMAILEDSRGTIWVGTQEGLNAFDPETGRFRVFRKEDGLPHNTVLSIVEDNTGGLWLGTSNGICHLKPEGGPGQWEPVITNYDISDGLQGTEFTENAAFKTSEGELIFGGVKGINIFHPEKIEPPGSSPKVVLLDFSLFSKKLKPGDKIDGRTVLASSITESREITLHHNANSFEVGFAALDFFYAEKTSYRYKLDGFNQDWVPADRMLRRATYTNIDPGEYTFRVSASNREGIWNPEDTTLRITILPPPWRTKTAYGIYACLLAGLLYGARKAVQKRERLRYERKQKQREARRSQELYEMKTRFFTNISHEFRTPLSLILAPLEKLMKETSDNARLSQLSMIGRNARRLLHLVNQLLDFQKLEVQELKNNPANGDIIAFIRDVVSSFSDLSEKKSIQLGFQSEIGSLYLDFDQDKLEKILLNLLSNAFRFTPDNGRVTVEAALCEVMQDPDRPVLEIHVRDTGIGIPADKQEKIFDSFYQADLPAGYVNQGSGIGLSIVSDFVKVMGGSVRLQSEEGAGSCFTIQLPLPEHSVAVSAAETTFAITKSSEAMLSGPTETPGAKPALLLVEDHDEFRTWLRDNLRDYYQVIEAVNGREGLARALDSSPELIVSDVMMPKMNGLELCRQLKSNAATSHVPVLLLTARSSEEQKLEGYDTGAQDYIVKPFNLDLLLSRLRSMRKQQQAAREAFRKQIIIKGKDIPITPVDEKFIESAISIVEKNIGNPDFSIGQFGREIGMSRIHLYRRLHALTGKAPVDFVRAIRMERAQQLLEKSQLTVAEIAYQVGYNDPKYFTRQFRKVFNILPSQLSGKHSHN